MISIEHSFIIRQRSVKKESLYIQGLFGLVKIKRTINQWLRESERARVSKGTVDKRDEGDANRFRLGGSQLIIRFSCVLLRGTVMLRMPEASRILSFLLFSFSPLPYSSFLLFSFLSRAYSTLLCLVSLAFLSLLGISIWYSLAACPALCHALSNYSINYRRKPSAISIVLSPNMILCILALQKFRIIHYRSKV